MSILQEVPYKLFANCIPVKGVSRSCICDLQRNKIHLIPNSMFELLEESQGKTISQIKEETNHQYDEIIDEYFGFLNTMELILFDENLDHFPEMNLQWHTPSTIISAIIDVNRNSEHDYEKIMRSLDEMTCQYIQIRSYDRLSIAQCQEIVNATKLSTIVSLELIVAYDLSISNEEWCAFCDMNKRITSLIVHSSSFTKQVFSWDFAVPVSFTERNILNEKCCGIVRERDFVVSVDTYTESLAHNTCLNRKISIDIDGNIKNCPSTKESFGNIRDTTLSEALNKPDFKKYWNITKDHISVCKDCEFRHVCTDCRAYLEDSDDNYSKPLKCGYNPYTCEWEEWSTLPMKQQAMEHYGMQELFRKI